MIGRPRTEPSGDACSGAETGALRAPSPLRRLAARLQTGHARDTAWALLDQGASLVASTASFLLLGRTLGAAGYGAFVGLYALIGPFLALGQSGVYLTAMEHIARAGEPPADVARSCMSISLVNAALWVPVLSAAAVFWNEGIPALAAVLLVANEFFLTALVQQSTGIVQAVTGYPAAARLRIASSLLRVIPLVVLASAGALSLTTVAVGQTFAIGSAMLLAVSTTSRLAGTPVVPGRIQRRHVRSVLLYAVQIGASNVQSDGDKFALNAAHHQADAGRYGAAYRIMLFAQLPLTAMVNAVHVSFLRSGAAVDGHLRRALRLSLIAAACGIPAALGLLLVSPLAPLVLTRDFSETTRMLRWLAPLSLLRGQWTFPMNGLLGLGRNALRARLIVANALLSLVLYAALIPTYSWRGALAAAFVTELSLATLGWVALLRCERELRRVAAAP